MRKRPESLAYESSVALTNAGPEMAPRLLTFLGWLMSVRSRTTYELLPRRVTKARQGLEGAWHSPGWGTTAVAVGVGIGDVGGLMCEATGVAEEPQAAAMSAVTASSRS